MQRISAGTVFLAFIAVLFGLLGVYAVRKVMQPRAIAEQTPQRAVVPMASRDLKPGRVISLSDVALVRLSREQMFKRDIPKMYMADPQQIIGQTVLTEIGRGQTFDTQKFFPQGYRPNVADQLQPGERAVTIKVSNEDGLGGYATAGQLVDIIFRFGDLPDGSGTGRVSASGVGQKWRPNYGYHAVASGSGTRFDYTYEDRVRTRNGDVGGEDLSPFEKTTVTLMQSIKILALEDNSVPKDAQEVPKEEPLRVTVAVSPDQAETLQLVQGYGSLVLSLRHPNDTEIVEPVTAKSLEDLLGIAPQRPTIRQQFEETEVFMRGSKSVRRFDSRHPLAIREVGFVDAGTGRMGDTEKVETKPTAVFGEDIFELETALP